jgi:NAD+ diphosphatase
MSLETQPNMFANNPLDRAGHLRPDPAWITERLQDSAALFVPLWRGDALILPEAAAGQGRDVAWLPAAAVQAFLTDDREGLIFLGLNRNQAPRFAVDISRLDMPGNTAPFDALCRAGGAFENLRELAQTGDMPATELAIIAQAKGMLEWHNSHRFCAVCGAPSRLVEGGYKRQCTACQAEHFPRTDPVVIMVPVFEDKCLLGRQAGWPENLFSALAGFMEPGETIEEAVAREVMEEAGVTIRSVSYHSTQPWPFPSSLMIGCLAQAADSQIEVDEKELAEARWFSREELTAAMAGQGDLRVPPELAIAHHLIKAFLENFNPYGR